MKLKYKFEIIDIGGELSAIPVGDGSENLNAVLQINDVAAKMLKRIEESSTPEEALEKLCADYPDEEKNEIGQKLCNFLNQLVREGILIP